jgi:hypothetical protein
MQDIQVSISYHDTSLGKLPFLFVGENAQEFADCQEIVYPDFRTALGWMCKHKVHSRDTETGARSAATPLQIAAPLMLAASMVMMLL